MNELLNSQFVKNLNEGKLPEIKVTVKLEPETLFQVFAVLFFAGAMLILLSKIVKNAAN